jgi:hypothetical protein
VKTIEVIKYYGLGKDYDLSSAQEALEARQKKHPERNYALMRNMRGYYDRYQVVQLETVSVDWPEPADVGLPERPTHSPAPGQPSYGDFHYERKKWERAWSDAIAPIKARLSAKLNS